MSYQQSAEDIYDEMFLGYTATSIAKGSLLYNACMPVCMKLSNVYSCLDEVTNKVFAKKALQSGYSPYLGLRIEEMGIKRKEATYALIEITVKGSPKVTLKKDSIVSTADNRLYIVQSDLVLDETGNGKVNIKAEKPGSQYNVNIGEINYLPIKYSGITSATNEKAYSDAYDQESDQALYERYQLKVQTPGTSGNKYHYQNWALEVTGVGFSKCIPAPGNVKVIIANSNKRAANQELIQETYNYIDNVRPILAGTLTITTVKELEMNITANIEIDKTVTLNDVQNSFVNLIKGYFNDAVYNTKKISIAKLGGLLISINGVVDHSNLKINNSTSNISLTDEEIAVLGTVVLGVM